jgi:hypothetical protein
VATPTYLLVQEDHVAVDEAIGTHVLDPPGDEDGGEEVAGETGQEPALARGRGG